MHIKTSLVAQIVKNLPECMHIKTSLVAQIVKNLPECGRPRFHPWVERSPGEGNGNPLQYSCLENSMDKGAWRAIVPEIAKSWT